MFTIKKSLVFFFLLICLNSFSLIRGQDEQEELEGEKQQLQKELQEEEQIIEEEKEQIKEEIKEIENQEAELEDQQQQQQQTQPEEEQNEVSGGEHKEELLNIPADEASDVASDKVDELSELREESLASDLPEYVHEEEDSGPGFFSFLLVILWSALVAIFILRKFFPDDHNIPHINTKVVRPLPTNAY